MKTVLTYKAQPIGDARVEDFQIVAAAPFPAQHLPASLEDVQRLHREEAKAIAGVLTSGLPGGTLHALLVELLAHKVTLYTIVDAPAESPTLAFVREFVNWWEEAGTHFYDDGGLIEFYTDACKLLGRAPDKTCLPSTEAQP